MGLSAAEKNRRKRERKKKEKEERRKQEAEAAASGDGTEKKGGGEQVDIEIEYVAEVPALALAAAAEGAADETKKESKSNVSSLPGGLPSLAGQEASQQQKQDQQQDSIEDVLRRFNQRALVVPTASAVVSDDEQRKIGEAGNNTENDSENDRSNEDSDDDSQTNKTMSKRKLRELMRPSVAELKRRVARPDLVEAHDVSAADPDFLIALKSIPGTAKVPRHWGRKRKYLQGKRGFEKPPFKLPDFIVKTGITEIRDTVAEDEAKQSAKQKNRARVNPKMGNMDVDYGVLYDAFFKYQTKPTDLTKFGDLYYEGKELETSTDIKPGGPYSKALREALGMPLEGNNVPPPWLLNMQRYGPPPSYPHLSIPGLNAPLPNDQCQYGYHQNGWGKPPVDHYGRPLYGGNPFDPPGSGKREDNLKELVTSDGKTVLKAAWGSLPTGDFGGGLRQDGDEEESEEESSSEDDGMEESDEEEEAGTSATDGMESVLPPPPSAATTAPNDLRKQPAGDETPAPEAQPKRLYQVLQTKAVTGDQEQGEGVFQSDVQYVVPGAAATGTAAPVPEGAESVLSKAPMVPGESAAKKRKHNTDDDEGFDKNFKF